MTHLPETIYVIRKGDMVIRPKYDEYQQTNGTEIIRFDQTRKESPFKVQRIIERSCNFMVIIILVKKQKRIVLLESLVNHLFYLRLFFLLTFFQLTQTVKKKIYGLICIILKMLKNLKIVRVK